MSAWQEVRDLVTARETRTLADRVIALTEAERAEVGRRLPDFLKEMRDTATQMARESQRAHNLDDEDPWLAWERRRTVRDALAEFGAPLRIAGAGTITGPAAAPRFRVRIAYAGSRPLFGKPEEPDPAVKFRRRNRLPEPTSVSPPHMFLLHRLSEIYRALREGTLPPVLPATPTVMTGHLDPGVLVDRLERCATAGVVEVALRRSWPRNGLVAVDPPVAP
ncbi:hypothetical protein ACQP2K_13415 [Microbispora siamensis]